MTSKKGLPVIRIIDGVAYEGKPSAFFDVSAHELGHGHIEVSAVKKTEWLELDWSPRAIQDYLDCVEQLKNDPEHQAEKAAKLTKIACNRAKTRVRRLCKAMGASTLLTLTYRFNELDLHRVKKDLKEFNRRMLRELPGFRFVAAFEKQERGAYHVHMGTAGLPTFFMKKNAAGVHTRVKSFDVFRAVWRSVTKERGGTVNVARKKAHSRSTPAQIAAYLSKYMAKDFEEGEKGSNRYAKYGDFDLPPSVNLGYVANAREAVEVCYSLLGDRVVFNQHYSHFGDWFFLHGESALASKAQRHS